MELTVRLNKTAQHYAKSASNTSFVPHKENNNCLYHDIRIVPSFFPLTIIQTSQRHPEDVDVDAHFGITTFVV